MLTLWRGDDVPLEVLDAVGVAIDRLMVDPASPDMAAAAYTEGRGNPLVHALAAEMMARGARCVIGAAPVAQAAVFRLFQCLPEDLPGQPYLVQLSHGERASAVRFNLAAVRRFMAAFGAVDASLAAAIVRRNVLRGVLARARTMQAAGRLSGADALEIELAYGTPAEDGLQAMLDGRVCAALGGVRVLLIGMRSAGLHRALRTVGFHVAGEAPPFGQPAVVETVDEAGDPVEALARAYGAPLACVRVWREWVLSRAAALDAAAVVCALPAYDHPTAWIVPSLRDALAARGAACLVAPMDVFRDPQGAADVLAAEWHAHVG